MSNDRRQHDNSSPVQAECAQGETVQKLKNLKKYQSIKSKEKNSEKPIFQALDYMEEHLAPGSHVVLVGLIDAGFLYKVHSSTSF